MRVRTCFKVSTNTSPPFSNQSSPGAMAIIFLKMVDNFICVSHLSLTKVTYVNLGAINELVASKLGFTQIRVL